MTQARECLCECHKTEKLAIYGIFAALKMIDQFDIKRFGDIYTWYYYEKFQGYASDIRNEPTSYYPWEVIDLERQLLADLRLEDYCSLIYHAYENLG